MKKTQILAAAAAFAAMLASPSVAQVEDSFDNLVDQVLSQTNNANFFSAAVNTAIVDGSVTITGGVEDVSGTLSGAFTFSDTDASDTAGSNDTGSTRVITSDITTAAGEFASTTNAVTQNFGEVSALAAGAISDSTMNLSQTGALASSAVTTSSGLTDFAGEASNTTGDSFGVVQGALNVANVTGSVTMSMQNANGGATSVSGLAAGAINTGAITASFIGGDAAETSVNP